MQEEPMPFPMAATLGRTLTELDHARIEALLRRQALSRQPLPPVAELLDTAELVPSRQIDPDVVTMYSQLLLADLEDGSRRTLTLCYPIDADSEHGFVSVLSPIGAGLLGCRVGELARWRTPYGQDRCSEILALLYQPEASGNYTL